MALVAGCYDGGLLGFELQAEEPSPLGGTWGGETEHRDLADRADREEEVRDH